MRATFAIFFALAFYSTAYGADIMTLSHEQWYLLNMVTSEIVVPIGKSLMPLIKGSSELALNKSAEAIEIIKHSLDNLTN